MSSVISSIAPAGEGLPHRRGAAGDPDVATRRGVLRPVEGGAESARDEVERCPAVHLDRLVRVMGQHEHR